MDIAEFLIYVAYLIWPVAALGYTLNRFQRSLASWFRIKEILDYPIEIKDEQVDSSPAGLRRGNRRMSGDTMFTSGRIWWFVYLQHRQDHVPSTCGECCAWTDESAGSFMTARGHHGQCDPACQNNGFSEMRTPVKQRGMYRTAAK